MRTSLAKVYRTCMVLGIVWMACSVAAQTPEEIIQNANWFDREVAPGVHWRSFRFDSLYNSRQAIFYAEIDLNQTGLQVSFPYRTGSGRARVSTFASETTNAAAVINGNFFDVTGVNASVQYLRINGTLITDTFPEVQDEGGILVDATGRGVSLVHRNDVGGWATTTQPNVMATNIVLVRNGVDYVYPDIPFYQSDRHPRTALGLTSTNRLLMVAVDGRSTVAAGMSMRELQRTLRALGAYNAINMDGGGSTALWIRGEPANGIVNTPSDGSERSVANAIAISVAGGATHPTWDSRFIASSYSNTMLSGATQTVWMEFKNYGTSPWDANTFLGTTEARDRVSAFFTSGDWVSNQRPSGLDTPSIAPGATGRFTFTLTAPAVSGTTNYVESFGVVQEGVSWLGPEQNRMYITVIPDTGGQTIIVESRAGGMNTAWYSDSGFADSTTHCTAPGLTGNIDTRYGSTYRSLAGAKWAKFKPYFAQGGSYAVSVAWGAGGNRRSPITHRVVHAGGSEVFQIDQTSTANEWVSLGIFEFNTGDEGYVEITNENIDVSGSMFTGAAKFEPLSRLGDWMHR